MDFVSCRDKGTGEQVLMNLRYVEKVIRINKIERADVVQDSKGNLYECVTQDDTFGRFEDSLVHVTSKKKEEKRLFSEWAAAPLERAGFTGRTENLLKRQGCSTIADMMRMKETELIRIQGAGKKAVAEILNKQKAIREETERELYG